MAEKNEYDYLMEGLSVDEQMIVKKDNKGILTGPYGVVIDPKEEKAFKNNKSIAKKLGIILSSNTTVEDFRKVAVEIAKQNARILQQSIPEYKQLKPEYKYILLDSKHHTGVTYKNLAKDLLAHQNNPTPETLLAVVKDSRRVDKIKGVDKTSAGFDNRSAKVLRRANLINNIEQAKRLGLSKTNEKAGLNLIKPFDFIEVVPAKLAEKKQEEFTPMDTRPDSFFPIEEGEKVQYADQPGLIEDTGTLPEEDQTRDLLLKDVEGFQGENPFIPDFLEKMFSSTKEKVPKTKEEIEQRKKQFYERLQNKMSTGGQPQLKENVEKLKDVAKFGAEFIPGVGEAMAVKRVSDALDKKDYVGAAIETAAGALGVIPMVGDVAGKGLRALKKAEDTVPVFPKPERMFPEGERPKGGKYLNPITGEDLTGKNVPSANIKINPDGKPSFTVTNQNIEEVGTKGKGNTQIKTNLFKSKAGWKWKTSDIDTDNINTLISVNTKGKHYYTLETDFSKGVNLKNYPEQKTEPKLRPTVQGQIELGKPIGTISVRGVEHPVYDKVITFAEGGAVPMEKQMSMFDDGGLMDEGGTVDPVSGNEVPVGSTQKEVRDDIPAQLSEGEFVFPADVVRYIGLEKLMQMRQEAKRGLEMMDKMGQMGNADEAVIPDDIPFELSDLDMEDDPVEMQQGGVAGVSTVPSQVGQIPPFTVGPPTTMPIEPTPTPTPAPVPIAPTYTPPTQQEVPTFSPEDMQDVSFPGVVQTPESTPQLVEIVNPTTGERRTINYIPGVTVLPEGFVLASEYDGSAQTTSVTPVLGQAQVREDTTSERRKEEAARAKMELDNARLKMSQELFPFTKPADPFSVSTALGKLEPGTRTATGYIIGDNGEYLDPLTGEQAFFGLESAKYALNPEDKPPFKIKPGGVNEKFEQYFKDRAVKRGEFTANEKQQLKAAKTQKEKVNVAKKLSSARVTFDKDDDDDKIATKVKKAREKAVKDLSQKQKEEEEADTLAFKTGGLASKSKPKPKKMRQGGLASR